MDTETVKDGRKKEHIHVKSVSWRCPDCGFTFSENEMRCQPQKYVAKNPTAIKNHVRSFFVNCWASPWISWTDVMQEWVDAKGDPEREKVVVNTRFGEPYERARSYDNVDKLLARREPYNAELPDGVLILTAAVDVQDNRLEYEIVGWGEDEECWGIKKGIILGAPDTAAVWRQLDEQLDREYHFADGTGLLVARTFIDSGGHYTSEVYNYSLMHLARQRFAVRGSSTMGVPIIHKYSKAQAYHGRTIPLVLIGTDSGKQYIMDRLAIDVPGPRYFHFPLDKPEQDAVNEVLWNRGYDEIYFQGLTAEEKQPQKKNGRIVYRWVNIAKDHRNEPLDLRVYNLACLASISPDFSKLKALMTGTPTEEKRPTGPRKRPRFGVIKRGIE